ncbi:MAG: acylphosphatase [Spirochaetaceae bacterium]|jgi:acylphosphatase|nr:acylphosphatase [Spirochaetaceae bacterium]
MTTGLDIRAVTTRISGHVQGVGFRYWTAETAKQMRLSGWVRNLADGDVEVFVQGPPETVKRFCLLLEKGPHLSSVTHVSVAEAAPAKLTGFSIR